jgi:hypothetical protein
MTTGRINRDNPEPLSEAEQAELVAAGLSVRGDGMVMRGDTPLVQGGQHRALEVARKLAAFDRGGQHAIGREDRGRGIA